MLRLEKGAQDIGDDEDNDALEEAKMMQPPLRKVS